jgi:uncharacterized protein YjbI with pentapeptide repeats
MADDPVKTNLLKGEAIKFDSSKPIASYVIEAAWIRDAVCDTKNIFVEHATIRGVLDMKYLECRGELVLRNCVIEEEPLFAFCTFNKNVDLSGSELRRGANFQGAAINKDSIFEKCRFVGGSFNFTDAVIRGRIQCSSFFDPAVAAIFEDAHFLRKAVFNSSTFHGPTSFAGAVFDFDVEFSGVSFFSDSDFSGMHVKGSVYFNGANSQPGSQATFKGRANFYSMVVEGSCQLENVLFEGSGSFKQAAIAKDACFHSVHFRQEADFSGARFGPGEFYGLICDERADFSGSVFDGDVCYSSDAQKSFSPSRFIKNVDFTGVEIRGQFSFQNVHVGGDASFNGVIVKLDGYFNREIPQDPPCIFEGETDFIGIHIGGVALFDDAEFKKNATFRNARFDEGAHFQNCKFLGRTDFFGIQITRNSSFQFTRFDQEADFSGAHLGPSEFYGAVYAGNADFNGSIFDGDVSFGSDVQKGLTAATFKGDADFTGIEIRGQFSFQNVQVKGNASFNGAVIQLDSYFNRENPQDPVCLFEGEADFIGVHIGGVALFDDAEFRKKTLFKNARFDEGTAFYSCKFIAEADFAGTRVSDNLYFTGAQFAEARFDRCRFEHEVHFESVKFAGKSSFDDCLFGALASFSSEPGSPSTQFQEITFARSQFAGDAHFEGCTFNAAANFANASFRAIFFDTEGPQFQAKLNLAGCKYDQIKADWENMFFFPDSAGRLERVLRYVRVLAYRPRARLSPYDREAFMQLENTLRKSGKDEEANKAFLKRRLSEQREKFRKREWVSLAGDLLYGWLANFGIRPIRLLVWAALLVALGTFIFSRPNTVIPSDTRITASTWMQLSTWESFGVSLHQFLPIDVPMGSEWKPAKDPRKIEIAPKKFPNLSSNIRPSYFATIALRIPGWMLVPLGVASLTGLLKRTLSP